jgi:hypothetical protein
VYYEKILMNGKPSSDLKSIDGKELKAGDYSDDVDPRSDDLDPLSGFPSTTFSSLCLRAVC